MYIRENVFQLHKTIVRSLGLESIDGIDFSAYLQVNEVVTSNNYKISQIGFKKGGLKTFLNDIQNDTPIRNFFVQKVGSEYLNPNTAVAVFGSIVMCQLDAYNARLKKKLHYGLRLRSNNALGVFISIGVQDIVSFFDKGKEMRKNAVAEEICQTHHDAEAISQALRGGPIV